MYNFENQIYIIILFYFITNIGKQQNLQIIVFQPCFW